MSTKQKERISIDSIPVLEVIVLLVAYVALCMLGYYFLGTEFAAVMKWWGALVVLGFSCLPLSGLLFAGFHDGGWIFAKSIGLAVSGWLLWVLSSLHILKFTKANVVIVVILVFVLNYGAIVLASRNRKMRNWMKKVRAKAQADSSQKVVLAMTLELLFLIVFMVACYVKCFKPEAYGTEKFMDYGFMTSMMRSEYMPPEDFWYSGTYLNYYYLGQYFATFLTKLSGVAVNVGYNLALAMLCAFCFMLVYSILYEVMHLTIQIRNEKKKNAAATGMKNYWIISEPVAVVVCHVCGVLGGLATTFAGNMHYTVFAKLIPALQSMLGIEVSSYWFPDATRYIGYNPDTTDKTIHEFPSYSFVLGDLHAHVTNIMFVLTVVGILLGWLLYRRDRMDKVKSGALAVTAKGWKEVFDPVEVFHPSIVMIGFFVGLFQMTNYWDFPIYYVVSGAIILFSNAVIYKFKKESLLLTAYHGVLVLAIAAVVSLLFNIHFESMSRGIALCTDHTPFYQLMILWGLPLAVLVMYLISLINEKKRNQEFDHKKGSMPLLFQFINNLTLPELFILTIGLCAAGLVLMPEIVYVVDIYGGHKRANTMFKLTYQAFILFGVMMGYVITKFLLLSENVKQTVGGLITGFLLLGTVGYLGKSVDSWFGDVTDMTRFQGLDAAAFVESENIYDAEAIDWINANIEGSPVMLEANGDSYTYANRVSVLTGLPTVMGWFTHEWLWKDHNEQGYVRASERAEIVKQMFTSEDANVIRELIDEYHVEYVYVGDQERIKFADTGINEEAIKALGEIVFQNEGVYIVKVAR